MRFGGKMEMQHISQIKFWKFWKSYNFWKLVYIVTVVGVKNGYFREESLKTFQALKSSSLARFLLKVDPDTCACFIFTSATRWYALESDWSIQSLSANAQQEELGLEQSTSGLIFWYSFFELLVGREFLPHIWKQWDFKAMERKCVQIFHFHELSTAHTCLRCERMCLLDWHSFYGPIRKVATAKPLEAHKWSFLESTKMLIFKGRLIWFSWGL